jgi:hypothetical protein
LIFAVEFFRAPGYSMLRGFIMFIVVRTHNPYNSVGQIDEFMGLFKNHKSAEKYCEENQPAYGQSTILRVRECVVKDDEQKLLF